MPKLKPSGYLQAHSHADSALFRLRMNRYKARIEEEEKARAEQTKRETAAQATKVTKIRKTI